MRLPRMRGDRPLLEEGNLRHVRFTPHARGSTIGMALVAQPRFRMREIDRAASDSTCGSVYHARDRRHLYRTDSHIPVYPACADRPDIVTCCAGKSSLPRMRGSTLATGFQILLAGLPRMREDRPASCLIALNLKFTRMRGSTRLCSPHWNGAVFTPHAGSTSPALFRHQLLRFTPLGDRPSTRNRLRRLQSLPHA